MLISPRTLSPGRLAAPFVAIALIVGACSAGASATPSAAAPSAAAQSAAAPTTAASASAAAAGEQITVAETAPLGKFLVGPDGKTLYTFTNDTAANASTCVDACATTWPPLMAMGGAAPAAGTGVTGTLATFARADGSMQVSYNGKPLYFYSQDTKAGDTNGQGVAGKWFVQAP
jgi:predicted lipoprotein with Yx(FWY)xxD motif